MLKAYEKEIHIQNFTHPAHMFHYYYSSYSFFI